MAGSLTYFLFLLVAFLTLTALLIWPVFPYVVIAMVIAYLLHPFNRRMQRRIPSAKLRATILTFVAFMSFAVPLVLVIQGVSHDFASALQVERGKQFLIAARVWLTARHYEFVADWLEQTVDQAIQFLVNAIPGLFGSVFNVSLGVFVCLFVFYYFIKEGEAIWGTFMAALPLPETLKARVEIEVTGVMRGIFYGQVLTAIIQGGVGGLGLLLFDVPQAGMLTALMMLCAFFPFVGTVLVWGPAGLLKLAAGHTADGVGLLLFGGIVVMQMDNLIRPRLISQHSNVHPVVILIGIIGGSQVFGFIGFLVGPLIFSIFLQLFRFLAEYRIRDGAEASAAIVYQERGT
jgi:predicted PurR-regulated permease PerM